MKKGRVSSPIRREAQKQATFLDLRAAARTIFFARNFDSVSIDEIATAAGVSRATVYVHFASKVELLQSVLVAELDQQILVYRGLANIDRLTRRNVHAWLIDYRAAFDERRRFWELWQSSASLEAGRTQVVADHREQALAVLGERYAAFRFEHLPAGVAERRRAAAYLMLFQMEGAVAYFSTTPGTPTFESGIELLIDRIIEFCQ